MSAGLAATTGKLEKATITSHSVSQTATLDPPLEAAYTTIEDLRNVILRVVLLPPTGETMNRVVVLHCDVAGRPYRIDDFRQPLKDAEVIK